MFFKERTKSSQESWDVGVRPFSGTGSQLVPVVCAWALPLKELHAFHDHLLTVTSPRSMIQLAWQHWGPHKNSLCSGICLQCSFFQFLVVWASWASVYSLHSWGPAYFTRMTRESNDLNKTAIGLSKSYFSSLLHPPMFRQGSDTVLGPSIDLIKTWGIQKWVARYLLLRQEGYEVPLHT